MCSGAMRGAGSGAMRDGGGMRSGVMCGAASGVARGGGAMRSGAMRGAAATGRSAGGVIPGSPRAGILPAPAPVPILSAGAAWKPGGAPAVTPPLASASERGIGAPFAATRCTAGGCQPGVICDATACGLLAAACTC